jgi:hypothetical protein
MREHDNTGSLTRNLADKAYVCELLQREIRESADCNRQLFLRSHYQEQQYSILTGSQIVPQRLVCRVADHFTLEIGIEIRGETQRGEGVKLEGTCDKATIAHLNA